MKRRPPRTTRLPYTTLFRSYNNQGPTAVVDTINKANASCSVTGYTVTYNGSSHTATGACTGVGGDRNGPRRNSSPRTTPHAAFPFKNKQTSTNQPGPYTTPR